MDDGLAAWVLTHDRLRTVLCCLCGGEWEEQWVTAALADGDAVLGPICPRCLARHPAEVAARLRALLAELLADDGPDPPAPADAVGERVARLRERGDRLRSLSRQVRALSAAVRAANEARRAGGEGGGEPGPTAAADVGLVADRLDRVAGWGLTVGQVVEAERECFRKRFGHHERAAERRAVDDRYREYLAGPA